MFRIIAALIAGLLLCAQTPMLPGFPPGTFQNRAALDAAASSSPTLTFIGKASAPSCGSGVCTSNGNSIGAGAADRLLVVVILTSSNGAGVSTMTFTGVGATSVASDATGNGAGTAIFTMPNFTASSVDLVSSTGAGFGAGGQDFLIYGITGLSSTTAVASASTNNNASASNISTTFGTTSGGVAIIGAAQQTNTSTSDTLTGPGSFTQDLSVAAVGTSGYGAVGSSTGTATTGAASASSTWDAGGNPVSIVAAGWR